MHQQINLYQPVFRKQQKVFSAATLLQICAAVLALLLLISAHASWTLNGLRSTSDDLEIRLNTLMQQMAALEEAHRTPDTESLDNAIDELNASIDQRTQLLQQFDQLVIANRSGFAAQFQALAEIRIPGLWLEGVTLREGHQIELRGITLDARLVPQYLQQLAKRDDLSETAFETVSMSRIEADRPHIQFVLRNTRGDSEWQ